MRRNTRPTNRKRAAELFIGAVVFVLTLNFSRPAFAYLDPGTGSILLQLLLGGVAGSLVVIKLYWHKFKSLFVRREDDADARLKDNAPGE